MSRPARASLDFGGTNSPLAIHLASLGHDVMIFDLRPYTAWYRVYDHDGLGSLLGRFRIVVEEYYEGVGRTAWTPSTAAHLETIDSVDCGFVQGVACVVGLKE